MTANDRAAALPTGLAPLLKQAELQAYYGISRWTANEWVKAGCPVVRLPGGGRRFNLAAVDAWRVAQAADVDQVTAAKSAHAAAHSLAARSA